MSADDANIINIMHRVPNSGNLRQLTTQCSYCKRSGHNINHCDDISLRLFGELCFIKKNEMDDRDVFKNWVVKFALETNERIHLVKAYGLRKCGCRLTDNMNVIIEKVINNVFSIMPISRIMPNLYAPIYPEEEHYLEEEPHVEEEHHIELIFDESLNADIRDPIACLICYEEKGTSEFVKLNCKHELCNKCTKTICETTPTCPCCRATIETITYNKGGSYGCFIENNSPI
jgi:hypothetical protein